MSFPLKKHFETSATKYLLWSPKSIKISPIFLTTKSFVAKCYHTATKLNFGSVKWFKAATKNKLVANNTIWRLKTLVAKNTK